MCLIVVNYGKIHNVTKRLWTPDYHTHICSLKTMSQIYIDAPGFLLDF